MGYNKIEKILWNDCWCTMHQLIVMGKSCSIYCNKMSKRNNIVDYVLIIIPAVGAVSFIFDAYATLIASILTAVGNLFEKFFNIYTQKAAELADLYGICQRYNEILAEIEEQIYCFISDKSIPDEYLIKFISSKKKEIASLDTRTDKLMRKAPDTKTLNSEATKYLELKYA